MVCNLGRGVFPAPILKGRGNNNMKLFRRNELSLNRIRDSVVVREGNETLKLYVDCDATTIVQKLLNAKREIDRVSKNAEATDNERTEAAITLASSMFGDEQTKELLNFYHGDAGCVVTICGMYFGNNKHGLSKKITKAQKKFKA